MCVCVLRVPKNLTTPLKSLLEVGMLLCVHRDPDTCSLRPLQILRSRRST